MKVPEKYAYKTAAVVKKKFKKKMVAVHIIII